MSLGDDGGARESRQLAAAVPGHGRRGSRGLFEPAHALVPDRERRMDGRAARARLVVSTEPERFDEYLSYLKDNGYTVIALRDVAKYLKKPN